VNRGVVTDDYCRTTLPDIYAAGDCAESYDITAEESRVLALLPNAYMQGECAGINMAGGEKQYTKAIPMNAIGFFGLHIITAGSYTGMEYISKGENSYKKLITKDGLLKGYILVGDVARAGIYTALIKEQKPLNSIDFDLIKDKPQLMAFSRVEREKMLGGKQSEN
jgi:NAD(P)H-nitrite reductase large subunit